MSLFTCFMSLFSCGLSTLYTNIMDMDGATTALCNVSRGKNTSAVTNFEWNLTKTHTRLTVVYNELITSLSCYWCC